MESWDLSGLFGVACLPKQMFHKSDITAEIP